MIKTVKIVTDQPEGMELEMSVIGLLGLNGRIITHVPTGYKFWTASSAKQALQIARIAQKYGDALNFTDPEEARDHQKEFTAILQEAGVLNEIGKRVITQQKTRVKKPSTEPELPRRFRSADDIKGKELWHMASLIRSNWPKVYFGAEPYLRAMESLQDMRDNYGYDSAETIVIYFLSNATTWRGAAARMIKAELNRQLKEKRK